MRLGSRFGSGLGSGFLVLVLASSSVWAQGNARSMTTVLTATPASEACPVSFFAKRQSNVGVSFAKGAREEGHRSWLELTFDRLDAGKIVKVNVTVHGHSGGARAVPAGTNSNDDVVEIFQLGRETGAASLLRLEIWLNRVNTVSWIELTELEYADGSVWRASKGSRCSAAPDGFVLVAGAR
jgi:hypothetical protein